MHNIWYSLGVFVLVGILLMFRVGLLTAYLDESTIIDTVLLQEINTLIKNNADPRVAKIFDMRYNEGIGNKTLPWNQIAPHVGLSIQGCINVHDMEINNLKRKLKLDKKI